MSFCSQGICIRDGGVCIRDRGLHSGAIGQTPIGYYGYGQRAGGTPPTGIHSCLTADHFYYKTRTVKFGVNTEQIDVFFIINEVQKGHSDTNI